MIAVDEVIGSGGVHLRSVDYAPAQARRKTGRRRSRASGPRSLGLLQGAKITYQTAVAQAWTEDADLKAQRPRDRHIVGDHPANVARLGLRCTANALTTPIGHPVRSGRPVCYYRATGLRVRVSPLVPGASGAG